MKPGIMESNLQATSVSHMSMSFGFEDDTTKNEVLVVFDLGDNPVSYGTAQIFVVG